MQLIDNKPYLRENVVGDRADFGGVLSLLFFMMVIGLWLYSARGMVGTFLDWVGIIDKESNFQVISYEDVSSDLDVVKLKEEKQELLSPEPTETVELSWQNLYNPTQTARIIVVTEIIYRDIIKTVEVKIYPPTPSVTPAPTTKGIAIPDDYTEYMRLLAEQMTQVAKNNPTYTP